MRWYWLTCHRFTIAVAIDASDVVCETAPIARKFIGQPSVNLGAWMRKIGGFKAVSLP